MTIATTLPIANTPPDRPPATPQGPPPALMAERLLASIREKTARVGVVGMGYVGLPLAELFASRGFPVLGLDVDREKILSLREGRSYIGHIDGARVAALRDG